MNANETTPPTSGEQPQMTEEQVREYLEKVRSAPAEQVVSDVLSVVLNAASAKLGRNDGRLLIDLAAVMLEHTRPHLWGELATQVDQVLGQLRVSQVQAEHDTTGEPNDIETAPAAPAHQAPAPQPQQPAASKLWIPGRD